MESATPLTANRDGDGLVAHRLERPFRDGTTKCLFEPLDFLARLAALVPEWTARVEYAARSGLG